MEAMELAWLETAAFLSWVVKDFSWVLLIPETAWVAWGCAVIFESWDIHRHWKIEDPYALAGRFVLLLWVLGNGVWMSSELLYEKPGRNIHFPWFHGALLEPDSYVDFALKIFVAVVWSLALVLGFGAQILGRRNSTAAAKHRLNTDLWCVVWVLKDCFWLLQMPWPAISCSVVILYCLIDLRDTSAEPSTLTAAFISWLCANTVWLVGEQLLADATVVPRVFACIFLCFSMVMCIKNFMETHDVTERITILPKN